MSRSAWLKYKDYTFQESTMWKRDRLFLLLVKKVFKWSRETFGYRQVTIFLEILYRYKASETRVKRTMRNADIMPEFARKMKESKKHRQAQKERKSKQECIDHLQRQFGKFTKPNQCWMTDITHHIPKDRSQKPFYQSTIEDAFTGNIVAYVIADDMKTGMVMETLNKALAKIKDPNGIIIHSDHGAQYFSQEFTERCLSSGMIISKGQAYTCADNVKIESFHSLLKKGTIHNKKYSSREEYKQDVREWNEWYINYRDMKNRYLQSREKISQIETN
jgi:putative transposase